MKKEEKELIFNLLKNASALDNGFIDNRFSTAPLFVDDNSVQANTAETISESDSSNKISLPASAETSPEKISLQETNSGKTIDEIKTKILRCTRCQLARTRNNVVPGQGVEHPDVLVIGEGPGYDEDMQGLPFVGKAGMLLDKMLNAIQLDRKSNCYIANIVKCRPPENRDPLPEEQSACFSFLEAQIHILKPKMILCMGRISGNKMLNTESPVSQLHGKFFDYNGIPLMVTYHPSALLRNEDLKRPAWEDLKCFKAKLNQITGAN